MKKFLVFIVILFSSNAFAHMEHYKKFNKIDDFEAILELTFEVPADQNSKLSDDELNKLKQEQKENQHKL